MRRYWLASYPKSGNTWLRLLIANIGAPRPVDINTAFRGQGMASARETFDHHFLIGSSLLTHDEVDHYRSDVHRERGIDERSAPRAPDNRDWIDYVKVHDAYSQTASGRPLLGGSGGADGAVLILRDPRDVAISLSHHMAIGVDRAIACMNDSAYSLAGKTDRLEYQLRQRLLDWSGHAASWLDQRDVAVHAVRYEDLHAKPVETLAAVLAFTRHPATDDELERAVRFGSFSEAREQERRNGFGEAPDVTGRNAFFRRGEAGAWREVLSRDQLTRIEAHHAPMMRRLGYTLSTE